MAAKIALLLSLAALLFASGAQAAFWGGSSSAASIQNKLASTIKASSGVTVPAYVSANSYAGRIGLKTGLYLIGVSVDPFSAREQIGFSPVTIPQVLATFSFVTHKPGLRLTPQQLTGIFLGRIKSWNQIPGSGLSGPITVVVRGDPSAATEIVFRYLYAAKGGIPYSHVGEGPFKYPANFVLAKGATAQLQAVAANPRAIGYGQTGIALALGLSEVSVPNKGGHFYTAGSANAGSIIGAIPRPLPPHTRTWAGVSLVYTRGTDTYPIVAFVYHLFKPSYVANGASGGLAIAVGLYAQSRPGQALAGPLSYVPLPRDIVLGNKAALKKIALAKNVFYPFPVPA